MFNNPTNPRLFLLIPLILYLFFAAGLIYVQRPHEDEMIQSNVAVNLLRNGFMGIPQVKSVVPAEYNPWWKGLDKYYYGQPPLSIIAQACWFKLFGIGLFQLRSLAVFWGLIGLFAWYIILNKFNVDGQTSLFALVLISVDFIYTRFSASGRVFDIMCASLAFCSLAGYMALRERSLPKALLLSNTLIVMSGLTHPNGILGFAALLFLVLYHDIKKIKIKHILISAIPYFIGALSWGWYILKDLDAFYHQFFGIVFGLHYPTQSGFSITTIYNEIRWRYLFAYGLGSDFSVHSRALLFILVVYFFSFISLGYLILRKKDNYPSRMIFFLTAIYFFLLMFLSSHKWPTYLVHIVPIFAACVVIFRSRLKEKTIPRQIFTLALIPVVMLSSGVNIYRFKRNEYHKKFLPDINKVLQILSPTDTINAPWETSFLLGFDRVVADHSLGYYSKQKTDVIIVDETYEKDFNNIRNNRPEIYSHIQFTLNNDYQLIYEGKLYKIYRKSEKTIKAKRINKYDKKY